MILPNKLDSSFRDWLKDGNAFKENDQIIIIIIIIIIPKAL